MMTFLLWLILLILCWPLALFALLLYPLIWLLTLPFRLIGIAVNGILNLLHTLNTLSARILCGPPGAVEWYSQSPYWSSPSVAAPGLL